MIRRPTELERHAENDRLARRAEGPRTSLWTLWTGTGMPEGRRLAHPEGLFRAFDPTRSKLAAALLRGLSSPVPHEGERWLYLGAASGTTASHVADLVGPTGAVFAVEKSLRPFARLVETAERYPNLYPILADARAVDELGALVPPVHGIYADISQPDQVAIVRSHAREFLRPHGALLFALKTASMGRDRDAKGHAAAARSELSDDFEVAPGLPLEPFHRGHLMIAGTLGGRAAAPAGPSEGGERPPARSVPGRRAGPRS
jgi:fibrillarin-like rRNA methylase